MQSFSWQPLSQDEILAQKRNLDPGEYDFMVTSATLKTSKSGNGMIELILKIWDQAGKEYTCYDWLVAIPSMAYKAKHFWESVGNPEFYEKGSCLESDFMNTQGKVKTGLQKSEDGQRLNVRVVDYIPLQQNVKSTSSTLPPANDFVEDDIPF